MVDKVAFIKLCRAYKPVSSFWIHSVPRVADPIFPCAVTSENIVYLELNLLSKLLQNRQPLPSKRLIARNATGENFVSEIMPVLSDHSTTPPHQQSTRHVSTPLLSRRGKDMDSPEKHQVNSGLPTGVNRIRDLLRFLPSTRRRSILTSIVLTGCLLAVSLMALPLWILWTNGSFSDTKWKDALSAKARPSAERKAFPTKYASCLFFLRDQSG